ncbi:GntR family transcriptional regulator [Erysipelotrichaceae bacterium HCN-30851]
MEKKEIPLYMVVYEELKKKINDETYSAGQFLPSETELQQIYNVSRITVRRALADLEHDGFVKRIKGTGTKVLAKKKHSDLYKLLGFSEDAKQNGEEATSIILKCSVEPAPVAVAEFLRIEPNEDVYYLKRLRLLDGRIAGMFETYISQRLGFTLDTEKFDSKTSLYDFYEKHGVIIGEATETIEAIMPTPHIKRDLFMEEDEPIFYRQRVTYTKNNVPIEFSKNYYKASGFTYVISLYR